MNVFFYSYTFYTFGIYNNIIIIFSFLCRVYIGALIILVFYGTYYYTPNPDRKYVFCKSCVNGKVFRHLTLGQCYNIIIVVVQ